MKLGIFLLILGLLIAAGGAFMWQYFNLPISGYYENPSYSLSDIQFYYSAGIGAMILGGGLAIGGIIRMIVKR